MFIQGVLPVACSMSLVVKGVAIGELLDASSSVLLVFYCRSAAMSLPNCVFLAQLLHDFFKYT
jgi:hypothetical protein